MTDFFYSFFLLFPSFVLKYFWIYLNFRFFFLKKCQIFPIFLVFTLFKLLTYYYVFHVLMIFGASISRSESALQGFRTTIVMSWSFLLDLHCPLNPITSSLLEANCWYIFDGPDFKVYCKFICLTRFLSTLWFRPITLYLAVHCVCLFSSRNNEPKVDCTCIFPAVQRFHLVSPRSRANGWLIFFLWPIDDLLITQPWQTVVLRNCSPQNWNVVFVYSSRCQSSLAPSLCVTKHLLYWFVQSVWERLINAYHNKREAHLPNFNLKGNINDD